MIVVQLSREKDKKKGKTREIYKTIGNKKNIDQ
jgi:hypothetical protein